MWKKKKKTTLLFIYQSKIFEILSNLFCNWKVFTIINQILFNSIVI